MSLETLQQNIRDAGALVRRLRKTGRIPMRYQQDAGPLSAEGWAREVEKQLWDMRETLTYHYRRAGVLQ